MTSTTLSPIQSVKAFLTGRQQQKSADLTQARQTYRDLIQALAMGKKSPLGAEDIEALLRFVGKTDEQVENDCTRAIALADRGKIEAELPKLESAMDAASEKYQEYVTETDRLIAQREPKRAELAHVFSQAEHLVSQASAKLQQRPQPEQPPEGWTDLLGRIDDCRRRSQQRTHWLTRATSDGQQECARLEKEAQVATGSEREQLQAKLNRQKSTLAETEAIADSWKRRQEQFAAIERQRAEHICPATGLWIGPLDPPENLTANLSFSSLEIPDHLRA